jgi:6-phosphogluconate dehydrogenase
VEVGIFELNKILMIRNFEKKVIFIMGVSGSGKTSIGQLLANELSVPFMDADDYHPVSNIEKMRQGIPLQDSDRIPWLGELHKIAKSHIGTGCVIACSALKEAYRQQLEQSIASNVAWIYLKGSYEEIFQRIKNRQGHFMGAEMLKSQFDTLEAPQNAIAINISDSPAVIVQKIKYRLSMQTEIGVIGLGVMGKSLSRNLARNGFSLSMYNRHVPKKEENIAVDFQQAYPELKQTLPFDDLQAFVQSMETPRKIILMVNAGAAVDAVLTDLSSLLEKGDIVIDGGNSHFEDTNRRIGSMQEKGLFFIGAGISGGEEGALKGPSIMPSGEQTSYAKVQKYLEAIAAKDSDGKPCCTYVGNQGSGHFVKMTHNGIEYAEMQLLAECYAILKNKGLSNEAIATAFESWGDDLGSYLLGITVDILRKKEGDAYLLDKILDKAANKGTGKWATDAITDFGEPATMIPAALFARFLSFFKEKREETAKIFSTTDSRNEVSILQLKEAYQFSRIINHHQGFSIIKRASNQNDWNVNLSEIARIWTEGCIIKSKFMKELVECLKTDSSILWNDQLASVVKATYPSIQSVVIECIKHGIHAPCLIEAVNFFHGIKTANASANLIQAQRDYFGAHTYQRIDAPLENSYHTKW